MRASRTVSAVVVLLAVTCLFATSYGRTWNVPVEAATIQAGIDSASAGDTVLVACDTYYEYNINLKSGVTVRSETGQADCATIDGQSLGRVITCSVVTTVEGFTITGGTAGEGGGIYCTTNSTFSNCRFVNNHAGSYGGGLCIETGADPTLIACQFESNTSNSYGGGVFMRTNCEPSFTDCDFLSNSAVNYGGAFSNWLGGFPEFTRCRFDGNSSGDRAGATMVWITDPTFDYCIFAGNSAAGPGGAIYTHGSSTALNNCTFYGNESQVSQGDAVYLSSGGLSFSNCIISFGTQAEAVYCASDSPNLVCTDVYGNAGGDYVGCLAAWADTNGNFSEDPIFCDAAGGDYRVWSHSPCLDYGGCGMIGALGRGCFGYNPWIASIEDIGNDQGRSVRLSWERTKFDAPGDTVDIDGYEIYRRQDEFLAGPGGSAPVRLSEGGDTEAPLAAGWDHIGAVRAHGESLYQFIAPTLCDSTAQDSICWSVFMVRATTPDPFWFLDSYPDSGYSVDNLAPSPPPGLTMTSPTDVAWEEVPDTDFDYYSVYGSNEPELDEMATLIGYTIGTNQEVSGHVYDYYHVTATDFSGNEGGESSVDNSFAGIPELPDARDIPAAFALRQNRPNPFSTRTVIAFDLPRATDTQITVYDTHGRLIRRVADRDCDAGRHVISWHGEDESGCPVGSGVYFIRMEAGTFKDMKKVMLLR